MTSENEAWASQLRKGVLELAVLGLLAQQPRYGSQLVDDLAAHPALAISAGTVYPLLARLARSDLVRTTWQESPSGPPRKYYALSDAGRAQLHAMTVAFDSVATALRSVLDGA